MRLLKPSCFSHPTIAATSRESNCSWMVDSRKCRVIGAPQLSRARRGRVSVSVAQGHEETPRDPSRPSRPPGIGDEPDRRTRLAQILDLPAMKSGAVEETVLRD